MGRQPGPRAVSIYRSFLTAFLSIVCVVAANAAAAQSLPACARESVTLSRTLLAIDAVGTWYRSHNASVFVRAPGNCTWTVAAGGFVVVASGRETYTESAATVQFIAGPNPDTTARTAVILINGQALVAIQGGHPIRTVPMDLDGDGRSELCTRLVVGGVDPYSWQCQDNLNPFTKETFPLGRHPDQMVPADYNGDHIVDAAAFRPSTGEWFILEAGAIRSVRWGIAGDIPVPADYDGDGKADIAVYRPATGYWYVQGLPRFILLPPRLSATPLPGDYDGDGRAEPALVSRSTTGVSWTIRYESDPAFDVTVTWGQAGDIPVPGDYDGNRITDIAVFRPATGQWFIRNIGIIQWGAYGDIPLALDVDGAGHVAPVVLRQTGTDDFSGTWFVRHGDGSASSFNGSFLPLMQRPVMLSMAAGETDDNPDRRADMTLFRPSEGAWYSWNSTTGFSSAVQRPWGLASDQPVAFDHGICLSASACLPEGRHRPAVFRSGVWHTYQYPSAVWGLDGDVPVPGDYLGTLIGQLAVFRPATGVWFVQGMNPVQWGLPNDMPVPADYDGDGRLDVAIWRPSTGLWAIICSSGRASIYQAWGMSGDIPVPADYDGDGRADFAVFRPSTGAWHVFMQAGYSGLHRIPTGTTPFLLSATFGDSTSIPVPADYDGDGTTDIATWTPGTGMWSVRNGFSIQVGQPGDIPVVTVNR
jgi:hypothetical protein